MPLTLERIILDARPNQTELMDRTSLFWSVGIEACVSILSWVLVGWIVRQWLGRFISDWICGGWLVLCVKYRIWDVKPRTPEQLYVPIPLPLMIARSLNALM